MSLFAVSLLLVAVRSGVACLIAIAAVRLEAPRWQIVAQALSDVACAFFLVAYVSDALRAAVGDWWYVIFLYALCWEGARWTRRALSLRDQPAADDTDPSVFVLEGGAGLAWATFAVAPALIAGFFIVFDRAAPGNWLFPGHVPRVV